MFISRWENVFKLVWPQLKKKLNLSWKTHVKFRVKFRWLTAAGHPFFPY